MAHLGLKGRRGGGEGEGEGEEDRVDVWGSCVAQFAKERAGARCNIICYKQVRFHHL